MWLHSDNLDLRQLAYHRPRSLGEYRLHIRRPSDDLAIAPAGLLEQNFEAQSDLRSIEGLPLILDEFLKDREAPRLCRFVDLAGHLGCGRSWPGGIFESVRRGEPDHGNERKRLLEIGVGLAGIADD